MEIAMFSQKELELPAEKIGLNGSPTRVVKIFHPQLARQCRMLDASGEANLAESVQNLMDFLQGKELIKYERS